MRRSRRSWSLSDAQSAASISRTVSVRAWRVTPSPSGCGRFAIGSQKAKLMPIIATDFRLRVLQHSLDFAFAFQLLSMRAILFRDRIIFFFGETIVP